jgi:NifU-like protein involved in Fe-S cluster formation
MHCCNKKKCDVQSHDTKTQWVYTDVVKEHFFNPRNFVKDDSEIEGADGHGAFGSPACGDEMHVWIMVDATTKRISDFKWRTFGCASAIAATSIASEIVLENGGMTLEEAKNLKPQQIIERLGGLPDRKIHCSVLCDRALQAAIADYESKQ